MTTAMATVPHASPITAVFLLLFLWYMIPAITAKVPIKILSKDLNSFIKSLPYKLTDDQNRAIEEILDDCNKKKPMNRLLNGDVGSGKTIVCAIAILNCIKNGFSAILLAPTTILATQHYSSFKKLFKDFNIDVELCISSIKNVSNMKNKLKTDVASIKNSTRLMDLNRFILYLTEDSYK